MTLANASVDDQFIYQIPEDSGLIVDQLYSTDVSGIGSLTLTISGESSVSLYQQLLSSLRYTNPTSMPWRLDQDDVNTSRKTLSLEWRVDDGFGSPSIAPSALEFINLDPTITSTDPYITGVNNPLPIDSQIVLEDLDNPQLSRALVSIVDFAAWDVLSYDVGLANALGLSHGYDPTTGILEFSGAADTHDYQVLLQTVTYEVDWTTTDQPLAAGLTRTITWQITDVNNDVRGPGHSDLHYQSIHLSLIDADSSGLSSFASVTEDNGQIESTGPSGVKPSLPILSTTEPYLSVSGQINLIDPDDGQEFFSTVVSDWPGIDDVNFGQLTIDAGGSWQYSLDNDHPLIQSMLPGDTRLDSFLVESLDRTARQRIDITIQGSDDTLSQYASEVLGVSSEGKDPASDEYKRWFASQALGAPDSDFGDFDTAWSPRRKNSDGSNGSQPDEFIELGFSRSVLATGARLYETAGLGFVREIWGLVSDPSGNISYTPAPLWSGVDDAASNYGVLDITFDDAGVYLLNGLMILTDIDHSYFWEQIDAVELIGTAVPETYRPQSPSLDDVAGDNVVNFDEKESGLLITGDYDHYGTTDVELSWGDSEFVAELNTEEGIWWVDLEADDIPADSDRSTLSVTAYDRSDERSGDQFKSQPTTFDVLLDSTAPSQPTLEPFDDDYSVNQYEKYDLGITLSGTAEPWSQAQIAWDYKPPRSVQGDESGVWSLDYSAVHIPMDNPDSHIVVTAIDAAGNRSVPLDLEVEIDTAAPSKASIHPVHWNDSVNAEQKAAGVLVTGAAEPGADVTVSWEQSDGSTVTHQARATDVGVLGVAAAGQLVAVNFGEFTLGQVQSGETGEFLYIFTSENRNLFNQYSDDTSRFVSYSWDENGSELSSTRLTLIEGIWHVNFSEDEVPGDDQYSPIEVVATDLIGNVSRTRTDRVLIDTQVPEMASIREMDTLLSSADQLNSLMVKGAAEIGSTVVLTLEGETTEARSSTGRWTAQFTAEQLASINASAQSNAGFSTLQVQVLTS